MLKRNRCSTADFAKLGGVTDAALSEILTALRNVGEVRGGLSRRSVGRSSLAAIQSVATPHGECIQQMDLPTGDGTSQWHFVHPKAILNFFASKSAVFSNTLHEAHVRQPSSPESPWKLVWYHDETTPGNILALDPTRKSTAIYWSFAELGFESLSKECV